MPNPHRLDRHQINGVPPRLHQSPIAVPLHLSDVPSKPLPRWALAASMVLLAVCASILAGAVLVTRGHP